VANHSKQLRRTKGTTARDLSKEKNDLILTQFKSKLLQQLENDVRNAGDQHYLLKSDYCDNQRSHANGSDLRRRNSVEVMRPNVQSQLRVQRVTSEENLRPESRNMLIESNEQVTDYKDLL